MINSVLFIKEKLTIAYRGKFKPDNPSKYRGDPTKIRYLSLWERHFMKWCDTNDAVLWWASEEIIIPYVSPKDNKIHGYIPDFLIKVRRNTNIMHMKCEKAEDDDMVYLIEIKPFNQTSPPKKRKKTKGLLKEQIRYAVNVAKWDAAKAWCDINKTHFKLLTEAHIFSKPPKRYKKGRK